MKLLKKETCAICGGKLSLLSKVALVDGAICGDCRNNCTQYLEMPNTRTTEEIQRNIHEAQENKNLYSIFKPQNLGVFYADFQNKLWCVATKSELKNQKAYVFRFSEVLDYEFVQDGKTIHKSGAGTAIAGGILFGGIGLVAGGLAGRKAKDVINKMSIIVKTTNTWAGNVELKIITNETKMGTVAYRLAKQVTENTTAALDRVMREASQTLE